MQVQVIPPKALRKARKQETARYGECTLTRPRTYQQPVNGF